MKVELTRNIAVGGEHQSIGSIIDINDSEGRQLIAMGKAIPATDKPKKAKANAKNG